MQNARSLVSYKKVCKPIYEKGGEYMELNEIYKIQIDLIDQKLSLVDEKKKIIDKIAHQKENKLNTRTSAIQQTVQKVPSVINKKGRLPRQELGEIIMDVLTVNQIMSSKELSLYLSSNFGYSNNSLTDTINSLIKDGFIQVKKERIAKSLYYSLLD